MFNALKYTQELEKAGFSREQAEASMRILIDVMNENFATKSDLKELEFKMDSEFSALSKEMEVGFRGVDLRFAALDSKFQEMESKIVIKLGAIMVVILGAMAAFLEVFVR